MIVRPSFLPGSVLCISLLSVFLATLGSPPMVHVVIPFRERYWTLSAAMGPIQTCLRAASKQRGFNYRIIIAHQYDFHAWNKAIILNAAFRHMNCTDGDYMLIQDADTVCADFDRSPYLLPSSPDAVLHLTPGAGIHPRYRHPNFTGGNYVFRCEIFRAVNGAGNFFFNWGGEDTNLRLRFQNNSVEIERLTYERVGVPFNTTLWDHVDGGRGERHHRGRSALNKTGSTLPADYEKLRAWLRLNDSVSGLQDVDLYTRLVSVTNMTRGGDVVRLDIDTAGVYVHATELVDKFMRNGEAGLSPEDLRPLPKPPGPPPPPRLRGAPCKNVSSEGGSRTGSKGAGDRSSSRDRSSGSGKSSGGSGGSKTSRS